MSFTKSVLIIRMEIDTRVVFLCTDVNLSEAQEYRAGGIQSVGGKKQKKTPGTPDPGAGRSPSDYAALACNRRWRYERPS